MVESPLPEAPISVAVAPVTPAPDALVHQVEPPKPAMDKELADSFYAAYTEYSKTLRTWFVAYGVGGPVLVLSNEVAWAAVVKSSLAGTIFAFFMSGVLAQVALAALNKASMWALYYGELEPDFRKGRQYAICEWFSDRLWIDLVVDLASLLAFAGGTWLVFMTLTAL